jgi:hypothetical protein
VRLFQATCSQSRVSNRFRRFSTQRVPELPPEASTHGVRVNRPEGQMISQVSEVCFTIAMFCHLILNSLPSAWSVAYNPSGEILICREDEDLLCNMVEENKTIP